MACGGFLPLLGVLAYHTWIWDDPFSTPYAHLLFSNLREGREQAGFQWAGVWAALTHGKLGLLLFMPWSVFAVVGVRSAPRDGSPMRAFRDGGIVCLTLALGFCGYWVAVNPDDAAFNRHLSPAFPFWRHWLPSGFLDGSNRSGTRAFRGLLFGATFLSGIYIWVTNWTFPYHPAFFQAPIWELNMPLMASGAHVAPIHLNPYDISGVGSPEGNWFEIG